MIKDIAPTYGAASGTGVFAVRNSLGMLELAMRERSCAAETKARSGEPVKAEWK